MLCGIIDDDKVNAAIGIMSEAKVAGGLPVTDIPDNEAAETDGESEYARPSVGMLRGADIKW
jgi:hypothetical protein